MITNGLDYAGTDALLNLLAGEQTEAECALWVEWLSTLKRSEADPDSALTAQWSTIRRARVAAPATLRALLWDAAMNAWSLGDTDAGLRAAREYVEVERTLGSSEDGVEPPWAGLALVAAGLFQAGDIGPAMVMRREAIERARDVDPTAIPFDRLLSVVFLRRPAPGHLPRVSQPTPRRDTAPTRSVRPPCLPPGHPGLAGASHGGTGRARSTSSPRPGRWPPSPVRPEPSWAWALSLPSSPASRAGRTT